MSALAYLIGIPLLVAVLFLAAEAIDAVIGRIRPRVEKQHYPGGPYVAASHNPPAPLF